MRFDTLTLNYLRSLFAFSSKPQPVLNGTRTKHDRMASPLIGKMRVPVINGFDELAGLSDVESKLWRRSVYRDNLFDLTVDLIGSSAIPWTKEGPNQFDNSQMERGTKLDKLPANVLNHLKVMLAECDYRVKKNMTPKNGAKSTSQSLTTNSFFVQTLAEFFNKHLRQEITVNHLLYPTRLKQVTIQNGGFNNEN